MADITEERGPAPRPRQPGAGRPRFGDRGDGDDRGGPGGKRRFIARRRVCQFCADKVSIIDYKNADMLRRFVSERGKIRARRKTGTCAKHQRRLAVAIKRARTLAMLPYVADVARPGA